jgi:hypothetical protein
MGRSLDCDDLLDLQGGEDAQIYFPGEWIRDDELGILFVFFPTFKKELKTFHDAEFVRNLDCSFLIFDNLVFFSRFTVFFRIILT